jgi:hypothetical protein
MTDSEQPEEQIEQQPQLEQIVKPHVGPTTTAGKANNWRIENIKKAQQKRAANQRKQKLEKTQKQYSQLKRKTVQDELLQTEVEPPMVDDPQEADDSENDYYVITKRPPPKKNAPIKQQPKKEAVKEGSDEPVKEPSATPKPPVPSQAPTAKDYSSYFGNNQMFFN